MSIELQKSSCRVCDIVTGVSDSPGLATPALFASINLAKLRLDHSTLPCLPARLFSTRDLAQSGRTPFSR